MEDFEKGIEREKREKKKRAIERHVS